MPYIIKNFFCKWPIGWKTKESFSILIYTLKFWCTKIIIQREQGYFKLPSFAFFSIFVGANDASKKYLIRSTKNGWPKIRDKRMNILGGQKSEKSSQRHHPTLPLLNSLVASTRINFSCFPLRFWSEELDNFDREDLKK